MISVNIVPAATATSMTVAVQVTEQLCRPVNVGSKSTPIGTLSFTKGEPKVNGTIVIIPITVSGSIVYQPIGKCQARTKMFAETFSVGFTATDDNQITLTPSGVVTGDYANIKCCHANAYSLYSSLGIAIA